MADLLRVLIVEDNESDALLVEETIRRAGWDVRSRRVDDERSFRGALDGSWHVILSDYSMPGFGGDVALRVLNETDLDIPFILVSGSIGERAAVEMMRAGAKDYILKDDLGRLAPAIERELREANDRAKWRQAEAALEESEVRFEAIFEQSGVGRTIQTLGGKYVRVNRRFADILGYEPAELLGKRFTELTHPDDLAADLEALPDLQQFQIEAYRTVKRYIRKDGSAVWVRLVVSPVRDETAKTTYLTSTVEDITAEREAEERIAFQAHLLDCVEQAVIASSFDGRIIYWNRFAEKMYGWKAEEAIGRPVIDLVLAPSERDDAREVFGELRSGAPRSGERVVHHRDGREFVARVTTSPIVGVSGDLLGVVGVSRDITAQLEARTALESSERRYRNLFERNLAGVYLTGLDGTVLDCNESFASIFGASSRDEMIGHSVLEFYDSPDDRQRLVERLESEGFLKNLELKLRRLDGGTVWILMNVALVDDSEGARHLEGTLTDISDRKRAEEELRTNERKYRNLFERNLAGVYQTALDGTILDCNLAFAKIFGCATRKEILQRNMVEFYPEGGTRENLIGMLEARGSVANLELAMRRIDGKPLWILENVSLVEDADGQRHLEGTISDISDRRVAEHELRRTASYLRLLLESSGDGVFTIDTTGRCELVNASASEMLGYAAADLVGGNIQDVIHGSPSDVGEAEHVCPILETMKDGRERRGADEAFRRRDGRTIEVEYCVSPIVDQGVSKGAVVTFRDVTEKHQLESQLERMKRLDSLGKLAGTMAHEFNNVMMAISPWGEVLRKKGSGDPTVLKAATHILDAIQRGKGITGEILRFTRPTTVTLRPVDLVEVMDKLGQQAQSLVGHRHQVDVSMPVEPLMISADGEQLSQVIVNLLANARDAMPNGGTIHLRLERCTTAREGCAGEPCARIVVEDSGEGIPDDVLPRIFEPMFTTKRNGTGLGLFLTHQVIRRHGGEISVDSSPGRGTRFTISIPVAQASVKPEA